jgi:hypothetical protein
VSVVRPDEQACVLVMSASVTVRQAVVDVALVVLDART